MACQTGMPPFSEHPLILIVVPAARQSTSLSDRTSLIAEFPPAPEPAKPPKPAPAPPDPAKAKAAFTRVCSGCHELSDVDDMPPRSEAGVGKLLKKMAANGMTARPGEVRLVRYYLLEHYVKKTIQ